MRHGDTLATCSEPLCATRNLNALQYSCLLLCIPSNSIAVHFIAVLRFGANLKCSRIMRCSVISLFIIFRRSQTKQNKTETGTCMWFGIRMHRSRVLTRCLRCLLSNECEEQYRTFVSFIFQNISHEFEILSCQLISSINLSKWIDLCYAGSLPKLEFLSVKKWNFIDKAKTYVKHSTYSIVDVRLCLCFGYSPHLHTNETWLSFVSLNCFMLAQCKLCSLVFVLYWFDFIWQKLTNFLLPFCVYRVLPCVLWWNRKRVPKHMTQRSSNKYRKTLISKPIKHLNIGAVIWQSAHHSERAIQ